MKIVCFLALLTSCKSKYELVATEDVLKRIPAHSSNEETEGSDENEIASKYLIITEDDHLF